jgi:hypothetical protein
VALTIKQTDTKAATARQRALAEEYNRLKLMRDLLDAQIDTAHDALVKSFGKDIKHIVLPDGTPVADLFPVSSRGSFDRKGLEKDHPRIHAKYWTPGIQGAGTPRLIVH